MHKAYTLSILVLACLISIKAQTEKVDVKFISNSGFLIKSENQKILIDGIYSDGYGIFTVPSNDLLNKERNAIIPFDSVSMLLVSHYHSDHINPDYIIEHMIKDNSSVLVGTDQVKSLLENKKNYELVKNNVNSFVPPSGSRIDTSIKNVHLKIISLTHNNDSKNEHENLGFIINSNHFRIFHPGDAQTDNSEEYKNLNLANDSIDIAFIPYWFFDSDKKGKEIIDYLKPKAIIIIHIRIGQGSTYKTKVNGMVGIPPVYFIDTSMQEISFKKSNGELSVLTSYENISNLQPLFYLSQNYPNPFNPITIIKYSIPFPSSSSPLIKGRNELRFLTLKVYDTLGKEVSTLVNGEKPAGNYQIEFNGTNLASGIYFYTLRSDDFLKVKKMQLLK